MSYMRPTIIWISGLIAFTLFGGLLGGLAGNGGDEDKFYSMIGLGIFAGPFLFICLRLWSTEKKATRDTTFD